MSESSHRFIGIPAELWPLLSLAERQRESVIQTIERIDGGRSGALLFLISEESTNTRRVEQGIIKIDDSARGRLEVTNLYKARANAGAFDTQIAQTWGSPDCIEHDGRALIFYRIVGDSLQNYRSLDKYADSAVVGEVFQKVGLDLLNRWNEQHVTSLLLPRDLLLKWLGNRADARKSRIPEFLQKSCHVGDPETPRLVIDNQILPNPYAYIQNRALWGRVRRMAARLGFGHGDLNLRNILVNVAPRTDRIVDYQLIDFSHFETKVGLLFDLRYLELSYLLDLLDSVNGLFADWITTLLRIVPTGKRTCDEATTLLRGACEAIRSIEQAFEIWIDSSAERKRSIDDLRGQFHLAAVAVGLNFCHKRGLSTQSRRAAFVYAAAHLKAYCANFGIDLTGEVAELKLFDIEQERSLGADWAAFQDACHGFDNEHLYVLVAGSQAEKSSVLSALGRVRWTLVIDFDPATREGLYNLVVNESDNPFQTYLLTREDQDRVTFHPKRAMYWYAARGLNGRPETVSKDDRTWLREYPPKLQNLLGRIGTSSNELPITCIVAWDDPLYVKEVCSVIDRVFPDRVELVFAVPEASPNAAALAEVAVFYDERVYNINLQQLAEGLGHLIRPWEQRDNEAILLPALKNDQETQVKIEPKDANWLAEELTLVHLNVVQHGEDTAVAQGKRSLSPAKRFLRGETISWQALDEDVDIRRDLTTQLQKVVLDDLEQRRSTRINLYHKPGAGGTTVARRIAWNTRRTYPTVLLNQISPQTIDRLSELFSLTQQSILVIVDRHAGIRAEELDELLPPVRARNLPITFLVVSRRFNLRNISATPRNFSLGDLLQANETSRFVRIYSLETEIPGRRGEISELGTQDEQRKMRTPFYFGLLAFDRDFRQLPSYVEALITDITEIERDALVFLAMAHLYSPTGLPAQMFSHLVEAGSRLLLRLDHVLSVRPMSLVSFDADTDTWRITHYIIAEEILNQLIGGQAQDYRQNLATWAIKFIEYCAQLYRTPEGAHSEFVKDLMYHMFVSREQGDLPLGSEGYFAPLIGTIGQGGEIEREGALTVLRRLKNTFEVPHFQAHFARRLSHEGRHVEADAEAMNAVSRNENDPILHHILGVVLSRYIRDEMKSVEAAHRRDLEADTETMARIDELVGRAEAAFTRSRELSHDEYAYTSHIELLVRLIEFGYRLSDAETYGDFLSDDRNERYQAMVIKAEDLLDEAVRLRGDQDLSNYLARAEQSLNELVLEDYEQIIRGWHAMLDKPGVDAPSIRRRLVRAVLVSKERLWGNLSVAELEEIRGLMEQNLEEEPDNHWNIRHWFEAARRLPDVDIDLAIERLRIWYNKKASIDVLYYLYVLYALEAIEGSRKARTFAERFMQECKQRIVPLQLATQKHSFNWLGRGSGLSSLVHFKEVKSPRSGADWYRDEDGTMLLARIPGVIEHISSPTSGSVELRCGLRVYFTPGFRRHTPGSEEVAAGTFVAPRDLNKEVDFFLGFSYEGLRAYDVAFLARRF